MDKTLEITNEKQLKTQLDEFYKIAKSTNKPFYNLIEVISNRQTIMTAIHNIKSNTGSKTPGIDGKTIDDYLQMDENDLLNIIGFNINNYRPKPVKRVLIDKPNSNKKRPLGIPTILDRIIQELIRIAIEPIAEAKFYHYSFGFRPYRSAEQAMAEILERLRRNKTFFVIEGDIKGYFENIKHNKLIAMLWEIGIRDKRLLMMIKKMLKAGTLFNDHYSETESGTPQGGILSPLLANIYLNFFDWMIAKEFQEHEARYKVKDISKNGLQRVRQRHLDVFIIRYADDWAVLCKTLEQAQKLLKRIEKYFKFKLGLELSKEKTKITDVRENYMSFLGFWVFVEKDRFQKKLVAKMIPNMDKLRPKIKAISKEIGRLWIFSKDFETMTAKIEKINSQIVGIGNYFKIANVSTIYKSFDKILFYRAWKTWLLMNGKKGRWKQFTCKANLLTNRKDRHKDQNTRVFFSEKYDAKIGLTLFTFTKKRNAMKVNLALTPYTEKGREIYQRDKKVRAPLDRPFDNYHTMLEENKIRLFLNKTTLYNFEYVLNKEYAYNRDKGKCKCCGIHLVVGNTHCHHINKNLPMNMINKVFNLASLCKGCHKLIHNKENLTLLPKKVATKIAKYRKEINGKV